jgi:hypothetical protein
MKYRNKTTGEIVEVPNTGVTSQTGNTSLLDSYASGDTSTPTYGGNPLTGQYETPQAPKTPMTMKQWGENALTDVTSIGKGLTMLPSLAIKESPIGQAMDTLVRTPETIKKQVDILAKPGENKYKRMVQVQREASPAVEQAKLMGDVAKMTAKDYWRLITDPVGAFYEHPINSTLDVLAAVGAGTKAYKMAKAKFDTARKTTQLAQSLRALSPNEVSLAERTFANAFTIPTKRAKDLKPLQVSKKMVEYGVNGSLDDMKRVASSVTGGDGFLSKVTRKAVGSIPTEIDLNGVGQSVQNLGSMMLDVTPDDVNKVTRTIATKIRPSVQTAMNIQRGTPEAVGAIGYKTTSATGGIAPVMNIGGANALDAYDLAKQLERQGYDLARKSTYLTPNLRYEQLSKLYITAAQEITEKISTAMGKAEIVAPLIDQKLIGKAYLISPKFAQEVAMAKTFEDLRRLQSPFVKLSQMVDLSLDAELSAARKLGTSLAGRLGMSVTGGAIAGVPGMIIGSAVAPAIEPYLVQLGQTVSPRVLTGSAQAISRGAPVLEKVGSTMKAINTGTKSAMMAAYIKKLLQYGTQPSPISGKQGTPIPQQAQTGSMSEWLTGK